MVERDVEMEDDLPETRMEIIDVQRDGARARVRLSASGSWFWRRRVELGICLVWVA